MSQQTTDTLPGSTSEPISNVPISSESNSNGSNSIGPNSSGPNSKHQKKRTAWHLLARLLAPYKLLTLATTALLLCDIVGMLFIPTELAALINTATNGGTPSDMLAHCMRMLTASVVGSGGCIASYFLASKLAANVGRDMRMAVYQKSLKLSEFDFGQFGTGSMITRTLSDANVVQQTLLLSFVMIAPVPVTCVVAIVLAFGIDPMMGRVLLLVTVAMIAISVVAVRRSAPIFVRLQQFVDRMNVRLRESITGVRVIRAFGREASDRERMNKTFEDYASNAIRVNLVFAVVDCSSFFLMNVVESLIIWLGADRVGVHAMQIGSISALVEYAMLIMFFMMMAQFAILQIPRALACLERASQVLDAPVTVSDPADPQTLPENPSSCATMATDHAAKPSIVPASTAASGNTAMSPRTAVPASKAQPNVVARFDHVRFRFEDADEDTLHDLCFELRRGQVTAVIGETGSGKSTIAKLLLRFHDVTGGSLSFLGHDLRKVSQNDLRAHMAYVPQKAWLFSGTIAENLRFGAPDATDEQLWHALDVAQASFVRELPDGLNAKVAQGGTNFSGGQRQRLAIARALVRNADLYVFDDSFSALDYKTDAALRHALEHELPNAARLVVAQRVSTIRDAAQIVVLNDGKVVGLGTHDELMEKCPAYREIAESQSRGGVTNE